MASVPDERSDNSLIVVVGPTASGKTELAMALAERENGEIVSADSVQIYRRFDIGSGKPSAEERRRVTHHLVDEFDPADSIDAARFADLAGQRIENIRRRNCTPIVCGGTYLWVRALIYGLARAPGGDSAVRARHRQLVAEQGAKALHEKLARCDVPSAAKLNPNDVTRVSRALEVFELTGKPMSEIQREHGFREPRYAARLVGVKRSRQELDERIKKRVASMLEAGWVDEVRSLCRAGYGECRAMGSVGYRQVKAAVDAEALNGTAIDQQALTETIYRATRVFARRQRTWLRDAPVYWM